MTSEAGLRSWLNSEFTRNVLLIMTGSASAQAAALLASPLISRLFTPEDFGLFGTFAASVAVLSSFVTLEYPQAILLPRQREDAGQLLLLSLVVSVAMATAAAAVLVLLPFGVAARQLGSLLQWLVAPAAMLAGINTALQAWCVRDKAFGRTSRAQLVKGLSATGLQIGTGAASAGWPGLVFGSVAADIASCLTLATPSRSELWTLLKGARSATLLRFAREYSDFPLYSSTQNLMNAVSNGLPIMMLLHYHGAAVAGAYAFAMRMLAAPISLISGALRQVLLQRAAEVQHAGHSLLPLFLKSTSGLAAVGLIPTVALMIWAPSLFGRVFGQDWRTAGDYARYLVPWLLVAFCNLPAVLCARLIRMQRTVLVYEALSVACRAAAVAFGGIYLGAEASIALFAAVGIAVNLLLITLVWKALAWPDADGHAHA